MIQAEKLHGYNIHVAKKQFLPKDSCNVDFESYQFAEEAHEYKKISVDNMFLPILVFAVFAGLASVLQLWHSCQRRRGRRSLFGCHSTLKLPMERLRESLGLHST